MRNWLYDKGIFKSSLFDFPVISVGNLTVGGTGKTPHVEFLLQILKSNRKIAVLSRGYKRKTKGFIIADEHASSVRIGDEPFQIFSKNRDVTVAVDEKRVHGINTIRAKFPEVSLIVLDDAFQHRQVAAGLSILLTDYSRLFTRDSHLPGGLLRENRKGYKRADIIVVTKCPENLTAIEMRLIEKEIGVLAHQQLYFSTYVYDDLRPVFPQNSAELLSHDKLKRNNTGILLVAGIVSPQPIIEFLNKYSSDIETMFFKDHYMFQMHDVHAIEKSFNSMAMKEKLILVTEKDASRIVSMSNFPEALKQVIYSIPIRVKILNDQEQLFIQKITSYVTENSRNS